VPELKISVPKSIKQVSELDIPISNQKNRCQSLKFQFQINKRGARA